MRFPLHAAACAAVVFASDSATAQSETTAPPNEKTTSDSPDTIRSILDDLARLNRRVEEFERQHNADQERIRALEEQLRGGTPGSGASAPGVPGGPDAEPGQGAGSPRGVAPSLAQPSRSAAAVPQSQLSLGSASLGWNNVLNPSIGVIFDMGGMLSSSGDDYRNRFNLREVELDIRAAVAPFADAVFITTLEEEIENPGSDNISVSRNVDIEEGYINFHTLPFDLALKAGKFRSAFGANNRLHTHALPQIDRPLAVQAFLGGEGQATTGASLSWLVPNPGDEYIELTAEIINADGGTESTFLGGPNASNPAVLGHLSWYTDLGETSLLQLGASFMYADSSGSTNQDGNLFGADFTYHWQDPDEPETKSFLLQGELFYGANDTDSPVLGQLRNESWGAYVFGEYQLDKNTYTGIRFDYTEFPGLEDRGPSDHDFAVSPYVSWFLAENVRLRLEYQQRFATTGGDTTDEANLMLGLTFSLGSHPPHAFGAFR